MRGGIVADWQVPTRLGVLAALHKGQAYSAHRHPLLSPSVFTVLALDDRVVFYGLDLSTAPDERLLPRSALLAAADKSAGALAVG